ALRDRDAPVRERAVYLAEILLARGGNAPGLVEAMASLADDSDARVRLQLAFTAPVVPGLSGAYARVAPRCSARPPPRSTACFSRR
ncbi:MAG: hypothetical protein ACKOTF_15585, partial [Opitutaceae bacterium]